MKTPSSDKPTGINRRRALTLGGVGVASLVASPYIATLFRGPDFTPEKQKEIDEVQRCMEILKTTRIDGIAENGIEFLENPQASRCLVHLRHSHGLIGLEAALLKPQLDQIAKVLGGTKRLGETMHFIILGLIDHREVDWLDGIEEELFKKFFETIDAKRLVDIENRYKVNQSATNGADDKSIARIIAAMQNYSIMGKDVYLESLYPRGDEILIADRDRYKESDATVMRLEQTVGPFSPNEESTREAELKTARFERFQRKVLLLSKSETLFEPFVNGSIALKGAEGENEQRKSNEKIRRSIAEGFEIPKNDPVLFRDREIATLHIAKQQTASIFVTRFGGDHNWREEIEEWNASHPPKEQFAMARITPQGYTDDKNPT